MLPLLGEQIVKIRINEFVTRNGHSPFTKWFNRLNAQAAYKVTEALYKLGLGNFSKVKSVGAGVYEYKIHFGPGYRIYFGQDGDSLIILLAGGTKKQQNLDINDSKNLWRQYKDTKKHALLETTWH